MPNQTELKPAQNAAYLNDLMIELGYAVTAVDNAPFLEKPAKGQIALGKSEDLLRGMVSLINLQGKELRDLKAKVAALTAFEDEGGQ